MESYLEVEELKKWETNKCPLLSFANNLWLTLRQLKCFIGRRVKDLPEEVEVEVGVCDKDPCPCAIRTAIGNVLEAMSEHKREFVVYTFLCCCVACQKHEEVWVPCGWVWMVISWDLRLERIERYMLQKVCASGPMLKLPLKLPQCLNCPLNYPSITCGINRNPSKCFDYPILIKKKKKCYFGLCLYPILLSPNS